MITQSESGLTQENYDLVSEERNYPTWHLTAYVWNHRFVEVDVSAHSNIGVDFDACVYNSEIYRVYDQAVEHLTLIFDLDGNLVFGSWSAVSGYVSAGDPGDKQLVSMASDATYMYTFQGTTGGIRRNRWNGSTWTGYGSDLISKSNLFAIAAVSPTKVHYITYDGGTFLYRLGCMEFVSGSWTDTQSEIYWPYPVTGFDAETLNGTDTIVITTNVPGTLSYKYVNNRVKKYIVPAGGVVCFTYKYGTWSDHYEIDILDEVSGWAYRSNCRVNVVEDTMWLTVASGDGTRNGAFTHYREYRSRDGINWTRGEAMALTNPGTSGAVALQVSGRFTLIERGKAHSSRATRKSGYINSQIEEDWDFYVLGGQISRQDMGQITVDLDSSVLQFSETLQEENVVHIIFEAGYWTGEEGSRTEHLVQIGLFEVDSVDTSHALADKQIRITGRDWTSWMSSRTQAEQFKDWEPQLVGADNYVDYTNTGYGGMGHTAVQRGSWTTDKGALKLTANNREGLVFSSYTTDMWNGRHSGVFALATEDNDELGAFVFRAQDKDNMWFVRYHQANDKIRLYQREAGENTQLYETGTMGWDTSPRTHRRLMIIFKYAKIWVYTSTDGVTWEELFTYIATGQEDPLYPLPQKGSVGFMGRGFSDEDEWSTGDSSTNDTGVTVTTTVYPIPILPPRLQESSTTSLGHNDRIPTDPTLTPGKQVIAAFTSTNNVMTTTAFSSDDWSTHSLGLGGTALQVRYDPKSPPDYVNAYILTTGTLEFLTDVFGVRGLTVLLTTGAISSFMSISDNGMDIAVVWYTGHGVGEGLVTKISHDGGINWVTADLLPGNLANDVNSLHFGLWCYWSVSTPGRLYVTAWAQTGDDTGMWYTDDDGDNWTLSHVTGMQRTSAITFPHDDATEDIYFIGQIGVPNQAGFVRRTTSGGTTAISPENPAHTVSYGVQMFKGISVLDYDSNTMIIAGRRRTAGNQWRADSAIFFTRNAMSSTPVWQTLFGETGATQIYHVAMVGDNQAYAWGDNGQVIYWSDLDGNVFEFYDGIGGSSDYIISLIGG